MRVILFDPKFKNLIVEIKEPERDHLPSGSLQTIPDTFFIKVPPKMFTSPLDTTANVWLRKLIATLPKGYFAVDGSIHPDEFGKPKRKKKPSEFETHLSLMQSQKVLHQLNKRSKQNEPVRYRVTDNAGFLTVHTIIPENSIWVGFCRGGINEPDRFFISLDPKEAEKLIDWSRSLANTESSYKMWSWYYTSPEKFESLIHHIFAVLKKEGGLDDVQFLNKDGIPLEPVNFSRESESIENYMNILNTILPPDFNVSKTDDKAVVTKCLNDLIVEYLTGLPGEGKKLSYVNTKTHKMVYDTNWDGSDSTSEARFEKERSQAEENLQLELIQNGVVVAKSQKCADILSCTAVIEPLFKEVFNLNPPPKAPEEKSSGNAISAADMEFFAKPANNLKPTLMTKNYKKFKDYLEGQANHIPQILIALEIQVSKTTLESSKIKLQAQFKIFVETLSKEKDKETLWESQDFIALTKRLEIIKPTSQPTEEPVVSVHTPM